ncbi:MAG: tetratricopeptide repeat protein [Candidatus Omnitrophica bacterium]|nr:tetratricopeptide repeat protein [Candidatus Omnitrophota bacterium]
MKNILAGHQRRYLPVLMLAVFMLFAMAVSSLSSAQGTAEADFAYAKKAFNDGLYELSGKRLEEFLRDYPQSELIYEVHSLLGRCYYKTGDFGRALYEFKVVLDSTEIGAPMDEAFYWTGEVYFKNGEYLKALDYYERAASTAGPSRYRGYALYSRGWAYYRLGLLEEALGCFKEVIRTYPLEKIAIDAQFRAAECEYLLGRYDKARQALENFIEKYPLSENTAEAYYLCGEVRFHLADYNGSLAYLERAISISPAAKWAPFAMYRMARNLSRLGEHHRSIAQFKRCLISTDNEFLAGSCMLGIIQEDEALGRHEEALALCDMAISKYPSSYVTPEIYYRKIRLLYNAREYSEAEKTCRQAIEKFPDASHVDEFHYELGWSLMAQGRYDDAIREFLRVESASTNAELRSSAICKVGDIYFDRKDYRAAAENYDIALDRYPESSWADYAQYQIGNILLLTDKCDQAILAFQTILVNFPATDLRDRVVSQLGRTYFRLEEYSRAYSEFEKLLSRPLPENAARRARLFLASSLYGLGRYDEALTALQELSINSSTGELDMMVAYQKAWCYYHLRREEEALAAFKDFLKAYPASPQAADAMFWIGEHYREKSDYRQARDYFSSILEKSYPEEIVEDALYQLAVTLAEEGDFKEAVRRFEELSSKYPRSELAKSSYRKIAAIKRDAGDFAAAIEYYGKALTADNTESNAQIQYEIAEAYELKGQTLRACEEYLKVPSLYSKGVLWSVKAQMKCAQAFERIGKYEDAVNLYEKIAAMNIDDSKFAKKRIVDIKSGASAK